MQVKALVASIVLLASSVTAASASSINYAPSKVITAMRTIDPKLKIVIAHRGIYGPLCPENSECAIDAAVNNGIEAVEIDVKESADGTPWPSHDLTVGRGTTYTRNGVFFDPYHRYAANDANNPLISSMHDADLRKLELRDINGHVVGRYKNISLQELLSYARIYHKNIVFVFDIKFPQSVKKVAQIVKTLGLDNQAILKFSATFFQPLAVHQQTMGLAFAPTLYAPQLDEIANKYFLQKSVDDRVFTYMHDFSFVQGFTYYEIGNKMYRRAGSAAGVEGPTAKITNQLYVKGFPVGNFIPVIEHHADSRSPQTGFFHTDGYCCTRLIDFLSHTKYFGSETRDDRTDLDVQVRFNANVITDNAIGARAEAERIGSRQDLWKILK